MDSIFGFICIILAALLLIFFLVRSKNKKKPKAETKDSIIDSEEQKTKDNIIKSNPAAVPKEYAAGLIKYSKRYVPENITELKTQKEMLQSINCVFPFEAMLTVTDKKIASTFESDSFDDQTDPMDFLAYTANYVNIIAEEFIKKNLSEFIHEEKKGSLMRCLGVISLYCCILDAKHKNALEKIRAELISEIYARNFVIPKSSSAAPVKIKDLEIHIDSKTLLERMKDPNNEGPYELIDVISIPVNNPVLSVYEDGVKTREYCLQTEKEDFTGKFFHIDIRIVMYGEPPLLGLQIDGFISDTQEIRKMERDDIGYRMEAFFLSCGGSKAKEINDSIAGQDLVAKGLKYPGFTTPSNIRLIGICSECKKSFVFYGHAFYMGQNDVAYSDDGLDCCVISDLDIDKDTWKYETDGKTFRYYNSFRCPHCGTPYIDYQKHHENKVFGVSGCVLLGRQAYNAK